MKRFFVALLAIVAALCLAPARADPIQGYVVTSCGGQAFPLGSYQTVQMLANGEICTTAAAGAVTANQGAAAAAAGAWPFYIVQGTTANASSNPIFAQLTAGSAIVGKFGIDQTTPGTTNGVQIVAALPAGANIIGSVNALGIETNPTSTLTRPANTTAYANGQLIGSNVTAGSVVPPSFTATTVAAGNFLLRRFRLTTSATTGWAVTLTVNFWTTAPTYTNGDGGAYAVATGGAGWLGSCSITLTQFGDAASGVCAPTVGNDIGVALPSGQSVFWDLQATGAITPISGQTFKITPEILDNQ